jgi:hypothetical protein
MEKEAIRGGKMESKNVPKREEVLCSLKSICNQLEVWAKSSKPVLPIRVKLLRAAIYGYAVLLSDLKDEELELRVLELEEKLKNSIMIPKPEEPKKR